MTRIHRCGCLLGGILAYLFLQPTANGAELLINGDFSLGAPQDDKPSTFEAKGWRRLLWEPTAWNSWLTDGTRDHSVGKGNQALEFRWGATSICQYFSAKAGETYTFSVDVLNPSNPDNRWQPRIQVEWLNVSGKTIGDPVTVAEAENATSPARKWYPLSGAAMAPGGIAYARLLLNVNNRSDGPYFQKIYMDNASVIGQPGMHNLPVSFVCAPYDLELASIPERSAYRDSLTNYADDKDGDTLTFSLVKGPKWLTVSPDGSMSGTPCFDDAGDNKLHVRVEDGRGSSDECVLTLPVVGHLRLANLFDDDMALQRGAEIPVWGKAVADSSVTVRMTTGETTRTVADGNGDWHVTVPAMSATPQGAVCMIVTSGERRLVLENLLVGEVWVCSGQSNMAWPLRNTDDSEAAIAAANHPNVRLVTTPQTQASEPWQDLEVRAAWQPCTPKTVERFSAVGYFFGRALERELKVPIGLISSSQGGARIEKWAAHLERDGAKTFYNSRIYPYMRMPIKGAIWYQGEANRGDGASYTEKMKTLVSDWRKGWGIKDLPFYFVQLAPFNYKDDAVYQLPEMWAAQADAAKRIPHTGMAVINDIGNPANIHPTSKNPVGERLARLALHGAYGCTDVVPCGPIARSVSREGASLRVEFDHVGSGLASRDGQSLNWFEVAGADGAFVNAAATIECPSVSVRVPDNVLEPTTVRFAWHEIAEPNLVNKEGLPAGAFRMSVGPVRGER